MNAPQNIFAQTRQEVYDFVNNDIKIVDGYSFNQYQTIKKCHLYYNSSSSLAIWTQMVAKRFS